MSLKSDIEKLTEAIRVFERLLLRGTMPDCPVLHELDDGSEDIERFKREYGCSPDEAGERGAKLIVVLTNFNSPNPKMDSRPSGCPAGHESQPTKRPTVTASAA